MRAAEKEQDETGDLRQRIDREQRLRPKGSAGKTADQRAGGETDTQCRGNLSLGFSLLARLGLLERNLADGQGKHRLGDAKEGKRAEKNAGKFEKVICGGADRDGGDRRGDDENSGAEIRSEDS